jgi:soluble lytic murein transglycosylase-like protein
LYTSLDPGVFRAATRKQIYLQRGRCLYRTNRKAKAYKEFEKLAAKYPRWRKSLDLLWVAAMDYEKKKQFGKAVEWYGKIIRVNPGHEVSWRARFRVGFIYYLQGKQELAVREFKKITDSKIWYLWRDRAFYWMAKSFEAMREFSRAKEIYYDLADHSIADYYTMKSYLIVNFLGADPDWQIPDFSTSGFRLDTYFEKYLTEFLPILTIRDIFGKDEAREKALEYPVDMNRDLSYYLALIYLNQEVGNYGLAYRLQVRIVNQYFSDLPYHLDSPITKFLFPLFYDDEVFQIARKYGINPEFVFAVMRQESAFKPDAESRAGAKGLLQLMPATARELHRQFFDIPWDEERLTDIKYNIKLGTIYLYRLKRQMNGNYFYTLAAYNAGAHRLKRWIKEINTKDVDIFLESITFNETRNYVRACMRNYWVYLIMLGTPPADFAEYLGDSHPILEEKAEW